MLALQMQMRGIPVSGEFQLFGESHIRVTFRLAELGPLLGNRQRAFLLRGW